MMGADNNTLPLYEDGIDYWNLVHALCESMVTTLFTDDAAVEGDASLKVFWDGLKTKTFDQPKLKAAGIDEKYDVYDYGLKGEKKDLSKDNLVGLLTHFIFTVTAHHEFVGTVIEYTAIPSIQTFKLQAGSEIADPQTFLQTLAIVSLTGLKQPPLLHDTCKYRERKTIEKKDGEDCAVYFKGQDCGKDCKITEGMPPNTKFCVYCGRISDWTYLFNDATKVHWKTFQEGMATLTETIDKRNDVREENGGKKFLKMHPGYFESSVSV